MSETNVEILETESGTKIKVYHLGKPEDTCPASTIAKMLKQIENKIAPYVGNEIFDNYVIEVWNQNRSDIPELLKSYGGLTWSWLKPKISQIKINSRESLTYVANILSHEFFHSYQRYVGYYDTNLVQRQLENRKQIFDYKNKTTNEIECTKEEMFPEYCRALFGADLAIGENHGNYPIAANVQGLRDTLLLYKVIVDYIKGKNISDLSFNYNNDNAYMALMFKETETIFEQYKDEGNISRYKEVIVSHYTFINRDAIYHNKNNEWIAVKRFK